jgi:ATP-dependent RNA helicase DDX35
VFDGRVGVDALVVTAVSQASANQRAGRAGRTTPGKCFRLFTEESFLSLPAATVPEIQRTNITALVLQLKALGIDDIIHFDFLSPPPPENLSHALELAFALGAVDDSGRLTDPLGTRLAEFPTDPQLAKAILSSAQMGCISEMLAITSMLSVQNVFVVAQPGSASHSTVDKAKRQFGVREGDHLTLLNLFRAFEEINSKGQ